LCLFADFWLSWWLITDADFVLVLLHCVDVDNADNISKAHGASIFRVKVCWLVSFYLYTALCFEKDKGKGRDRVESDALWARKVVKMSLLRPF
jgi:hypothetical protein